MAKSDPSKWNEIMSAADRRGKVGDQTFNYANRSRHMRELQSAAQNILKMRQDDPAGFVLKHIPEAQEAARLAADGRPEGVQPYVAAITGAQKALGIPSFQQKILTKGQAVQISSQFDAASSPQEALFVANNLRQTYGKDYSRVIMEAAGKNENIRDMALLAYTSDPAAELKIASNIKNRTAIREEWQKRNDMSTNKFDAAVSIALDKYRGPLATTFADSASTLGNAFFDQVKTEVQRKMNTGGSGKMTDSINSAVEEIVGNNFEVARAGRSEMLIPKRVGGRAVDTGLISGYVDNYSKPENLEKLGVYVPSNQDKNLYLNELASKSRWVMNPSMTGMVLATEIQGSLVIAVDKNKKPIERSFEQMQKEGIKKSWWGF